MRSPADGVDRGFVNAVLLYDGPVIAGLLPQEDPAVIGARGEDVAKLGVRPSNLPDRAFVSEKVKKRKEPKRKEKKREEKIKKRKSDLSSPPSNLLR